MAVLLIMAGRQKRRLVWLKAEHNFTSEELKETVSKYQEENARPTATTDLMKITGICVSVLPLQAAYSVT